MLSSLILLLRRTIGPSHPLRPNSPLLIYMGVGACASVVPVACRKPDGGLDSRNFREALRSRPELCVEERVRGCDSLSLAAVFELSWSMLGDCPAPSLALTIFALLRKEQWTSRLLLANDIRPPISPSDYPNSCIIDLCNVRSLLQISA